MDVEDLNSDQKDDERSPVRDNDFLGQREFSRENVLSSAPIRPTPFSALAAAVYQAAHPNWPHQSLVNPFGGPGPMFQGPTPFGVPNMTTGRYVSLDLERDSLSVLVQIFIKLLKKASLHDKIGFSKESYLEETCKRRRTQ